MEERGAIFTGAVVAGTKKVPAGGKAAVEEKSVVSAGAIPAVVVPRGKTGHLIAALGPYLTEGRTLYCLDGGNVFNPYRLSACARGEGIDPGRILNQVFVSRAYTCHQLLEAARVMLPSLLDQKPEPIVILLGLIGFFTTRILVSRSAAIFSTRFSPARGGCMRAACRF